MPHRPWYDDGCEESRNNMVKSRNKYRRKKNIDNLDLTRKASKNYKKKVNKAYCEYQKKLIDKLRKLQSENPKEYWKIIQGKQTSEIYHKISLETFKDHYEKLASGTENTVHNDTNGELNNKPPDELLNRPFTPLEITKAINKLKNNKAGGADQIINEFIENSSQDFVPIYTQLFNLISIMYLMNGVKV